MFLALSLKSCQNHSFSWVPQTRSSLSTSHMQVFTMGSALHSLGRMLPSSLWLAGGPPSDVLELAYTASRKLFVHSRSQLFVQGLQTGSWKLAKVGVFILWKLAKYITSELIGLFLETWFLNIYRHTRGSTLLRPMLLEYRRSSRQSSWMEFNQL